MKTWFDFIGSELDWFATDSEGCVGLFSSAGWGPIPDFVFEHFNEQRAIEQELCGFVGKTPFDFAADGSNLLLTYFDALLAHGVFCFDWEDTFGPYRRHSTPLKIAHVAHFDFSLELQSSFVPLPKCQFRLATELQQNTMPAFTDVSRR